MPFDSFDNKIKDAAEHHHPPYDEKGWMKMEELLDKHMPVEKDNSRKWLLFLLIFLFAGGAAWMLISQPWKKSGPVANTESIKAGSNSIEKNNTNPLTNIVKPSDPSPTVPDDVVEIPETNESTSPDKIKKGNNDLNSSTRIAGARIVKTNNQKPNNRQEPSVPNKSTNLINLPDKTITNTTREETQVPANSQADQKINSLADQKITNTKEPEIKASQEKKLLTPAPTETLTAASKAVSGIQTQKKKSGFFISFSTGPDISASGSDNPGKLRFVLGAGLGYTFHERFSISTGFYAARKIYTSSPGQYHPPAAFWTFYPDLQKVNADCKVYEIPLLLTYHFKSHSNHNWFASAGMSSYLMKEEDYDYYYKNSSGQTLDRKRTLKNANEHFFSILDLSGGYHRNINNTLSFSIEPYLRLPLDGIGYGKVKLNSAGVLFTMGVRPFGAVKKSKN